MLLKGCIAVPRFTGYASAWKLKLEDVSLIDPGGNTPTYDWTLPPEFRLENIITKMLSNTQTIVGHSLHRSPQGGGNTGATALSPYHRNGDNPIDAVQQQVEFKVVLRLQMDMILKLSHRMTLWIVRSSPSLALVW